MDTQDQALEVRVSGTKKLRRTIRERREIVEATLLAGASVSRVARRYDVNANEVFYWRKLHREGRLGVSAAAQLLPVKVAADRSTEAGQDDGLVVRSGTMEIELPKGTLRITSPLDVVALRAVIECLVG